MNEIDGHPERIIPDETSAGIVSLHLKRYDFAQPYVTGKRVLDIACGVGYGAAYLRDHAMEVVGVDLDQEAISYAKRRYAGPHNLSFLQADATRLDVKDCSFDVVCSFETIEHVAEVRKYLLEMQRVLVSGGTYIVSTPAAAYSTNRPSNPHHVQEWSPVDFESLMREYFSRVELFSQLRRETILALCLKTLDVFKVRTRLRSLALPRGMAKIAGVRTTADLQMHDILIVPGISRRATEIIAVCQK